MNKYWLEMNYVLFEMSSPKNYLVVFTWFLILGYIQEDCQDGNNVWSLQ